MTTEATNREGVLLDALRRNLTLLGELALRYDVETQPDQPAEDLPAVSTPDAVRRLLGPEMAGLVQEQLRVLLLDKRNRVVGQRVVYQGSVDAVVVRPAELFRSAVIAGVPAVIAVHNHPSGDPSPSPSDVATTRTLAEAGRLLGIELLDHVVLARDGAVSLREQGVLPLARKGDRSCS